MTSKISQPETDIKKIPGRYSSVNIFGTTILDVTLAEGHASIVRQRAVRMLRGGKIMMVPSGGNKPKQYTSNNIVHLENSASYNKHDYKVHDQIKGKMTVEFRLLAGGGRVYPIEHICRSLFDTDNLYLGRQVSIPDMARDQHDTIGQNIGFPRMKLDYTPHGHKLRLFTLQEAQFVTGGIISEQEEPAFE